MCLLNKLFVTLILFVSVVLPINLVGQEVEHNYKVGPQFTNCDSLPKVFTGRKEAIFLVEKH